MKSFINVIASDQRERSNPAPHSGLLRRPKRKWGLLAKTFYKPAVLVFALGTLSGNAFAMGLKSNATIESDVITLGDLFYDLPRDAGKVLGPAPKPGSEMVLTARDLTRVALAMNLPWRPTGAHEQISLRRAATLIEGATVKSVIARELSARGLPGKFDLSITMGGGDIILPQNQSASFDLTALSFDLQKGHFSASLAAPNAANPIVRQEISGSIERVVSVPVLKAAIGQGEVIRAGDIETVDVPAKQVSSKAMLNAQDIVGMTPRRTVLAGAPMSREDLIAPQVIQRGKSVLMTYKSGPLVLTAQGKALENAAKGETVRVVNISTNRTLEAVAVAENEVEIRTF